MKKLSQTQLCRSETKKKEKQKTEEIGAPAKLVPASTVHPAHCSSYCPFLLFTLCPVCICFWFFPILTLVIAFVLVFFVTSLILSTYISLSLYKLSINSNQLHVGNTERGGSFSAASFSHFLSFSFPFLGYQTLL